MEVRNKKKVNKEICSKQVSKKALLNNGCITLTQNAKKSIQKVYSLKRQKRNLQVKQKTMPASTTKQGTGEKMIKNVDILRLCRSNSSKIKSKYITESILTKSSILKRPLLESNCKGISPYSSYKGLAHKKSHSKSTRGQTVCKNNSNDKNRAKKERKFTDVCITQSKSRQKLIKRVLTTDWFKSNDWFKSTDEGKTQTRLQNQQQACIRKSIIYDENRIDQLKGKNETKVGSESTLVTDQTSQGNSLGSSGCNSRIEQESHKKIRVLKFHVNLQGLKNMKILDYTDQFMSHYDELSESWKRDITNQKKF